MAIFYFSQHAVALQRFRIILPLHVRFRFYPDSTHWKSRVVIVPTTTPGTTGNKTTSIMITFGFKYSFLIFILLQSVWCCQLWPLRYHFHMANRIAKMITHIKTVESKICFIVCYVKYEVYLTSTPLDILRFVCCQWGTPRGTVFSGAYEIS